MMRNSSGIGKRNKNGFTLVELCIVMAIMAIIGGMITTFMIMYTNHTKRLDIEYSLVGDMATCQEAVDEWLHNYDSAEHEFETTLGSLVVYDVTINKQARSVDLAYTRASSPSAMLRYSDGKLIWEEHGSTKKVFDIPTITGVTFSVDDRVVTSNIKYGNNQSQKLLFAIFSHVTRTRYASDKRQGK